MAGGPQDSAPVDFDVLDDMRKYLARSERFDDVEFRPEYAPDSLVCVYERGYYPPTIEEAFLQITWYKNDDFNVHYQEHWADGKERKCRWDRHPNDHNARDHYHPLPDAATPGEDRSYSRNWKDVLARVLTVVDGRIEAFWR
jgi:hypothetical protein